MNISVDKVTGAVPVTVLRLEGDLDASSYESLIDAGRKAVDTGAHDILVDLRKVPFMGSSGLVAFHTIALLLSGEEPPDLDGGWGAHHAMQSSIESGPQEHLRLLGPVASVRRALERTGMDRFLPIHDDEAAAIAAFR
ncbi:MAG: STAS domain-containing protein [Chloroflexota bacterium]